MPHGSGKADPRQVVLMSIIEHDRGVLQAVKTCKGA
jgi:hypothetical protein